MVGEFRTEFCASFEAAQEFPDKVDVAGVQQSHAEVARQAEVGLNPGPGDLAASAVFEALDGLLAHGEPPGELGTTEPGAITGYADLFSGGHAARV